MDRRDEVGRWAGPSEAGPGLRGLVAALGGWGAWGLERTVEGAAALMAGHQLEAVIPHVMKTSERMAEVGASIREQGRAVEHVRFAVEQFAQLVPSNAASSDRLDSTAEGLTRSSRALVESVAYFRLPTMIRSTPTHRPRLHPRTPPPSAAFGPGAEPIPIQR